MTALFLPPPSDPPDPDFRETLEGGHALILGYAPGHAIVIEYGDCEFWISCECGYKVPSSVRPNRPLYPAVMRVVQHAFSPGYALKPYCQCGARFRGSAAMSVAEVPIRLDSRLSAWESHSMGVGR